MGFMLSRECDITSGESVITGYNRFGDKLISVSGGNVLYFNVNIGAAHPGWSQLDADLAVFYCQQNL